MFRVYCIFFCSLSFAQVKQQKTWNIEGLKIIIVNCFWANKIVVSTHSSPTIIAKYKQEGEYQNRYLLKAKRKDNAFYIQENQRLFFDNPNDKLSVHKVIANQLRLTIPENLNLKLTAKEAQLNFNGDFEMLDIKFNHGKAFFNISKPKGTIMTLDGNLYFYNIESNKIPKKLKIINKRGNIIINPKNNLFSL